jgi:transcriptional regulator with PAS, ATPase and Fis domain
MPSELVGSELFGHEKGAFTGAVERHKGKFEIANNGTIFLDEIDSIEEKVQVSLLRLIEQKQFHRLGGKKPLNTNARLLTASNENLEELVQAGAFRKDLFYRLDVFRIIMPPLRMRFGDISLLANKFLSYYNKSLHKKITGISPQVVNILETYEWPGNIREMKNVLHHAALMCEKDEISIENLPQRFQSGSPLQPVIAFEVGTPLHEVERKMILKALEVTQNNRKKAAELLGISRRAIYNKLEKHKI